MHEIPDFSLAVVAHACEGPEGLRNRLTESGLDTTATARLIGCSPLALARATKTGSAPRGLLIGLAVLATVVDQLHEHGIAVADLARGADGVAAATADIAGQSPLAARMLDRLSAVRELVSQPAQLSLPLPGRVAA